MNNLHHSTPNCICGHASNLIIAALGCSDSISFHTSIDGCAQHTEQKLLHMEINRMWDKRHFLWFRSSGLFPYCSLGKLIFVVCSGSSLYAALSCHLFVGRFNLMHADLIMHSAQFLPLNVIFLGSVGDLSACLKNPLSSLSAKLTESPGIPCVRMSTKYCCLCVSNRQIGHLSFL